MARETLIRRSDLTEPLVIRTETVTDLGGGATDISYTDGATVMGMVKPMKGREHLQARQIIGGTPYNVTIDRAGVTIDSDSRLTWKSRTGNRTLYLASPPVPSDKGDFLTFIAHEKDE